MTTYLAIDPGLTTGIAYWDSDTDPWNVGVLEIHGRRELEHYLLYEWFDRGPDDFEVIIERWDVRKDTSKKTGQDDPRYIIGFVEGLCHHHPSGTTPYHEQRPVQIKSSKTLATDAALRALSWYSGGEGHADDAARHLLIHLAGNRRHGLPLLEIIA